MQSMHRLYLALVSATTAGTMLMFGPVLSSPSQANPYPTSTPLVLSASAEADSAEADSTESAPPETEAPETIVPDTDSVATGAYTNEFFGFSLTFPETWAIASQETTEAIMDMGSNIVANSDPALGAAIESSVQNTYQLFLISESPIGTPTAQFNPTVMGMAERISQFPGITSGADYLVHLSRAIAQINLPYEQVGEAYPVTIGGKEFYRTDFQLTLMGVAVRQSYVATIDQGYALGFVLSTSPERFTELEAIVDSIQFE